MIPVLEAIRALLLTKTELANAVRVSGEDYRIFGPQRTMPQFKPVPPKSIALQRVGGRREPTVPIGRSRVYVRCYASRVQDAEALYQLLATVFYNEAGLTRGSQKVGQYLMFYAELSDPDTDIEPQSGWPVSFGILESEWATVGVA